MKILIIEDEKDLAESIRSYLVNNGYLCDLALDFGKADELINLYQYDCIIVDITLPDGSGMDIIKNLKRLHSQAGIIVVSAKNAIDDKINGVARMGEYPRLGQGRAVEPRLSMAHRVAWKLDKRSVVPLENGDVGEVAKFEHF